jgi:hypothetical protein
MAPNLDPETDAPDPAVKLWRWFWVLVFGVVGLTLIAMAAIANANKDIGEQVVPGPDWPQCCDHWKAKRVSASKHLVY